MNKRALVIALLLATLAAAVLVLYVRRFEQEASGGERVQVLMAIQVMERGEVIQDEKLAVREIPMAYVEDRTVKASEKGKVVGLRVGNKVDAQQTLMWTDLAIASDERRDLSSLVQPGSRAVSIRAESGDKSYALIRPGDYVDVIANLPGETGDKRQAVVLLQRVLVLAVGLETAPQMLVDGKDKSGAQRETVLTLSVSIQEAQLLSLAVDKGTLRVVLRNPEDQRIVQGLPDLSSTALTDTQVRARVGRKRGGPVRLESE